MIDSVVIASSDSAGQFSLNVIFLFGLIVLGGAFGARLFQRLHIPQVVGCIVVGILLGDVLHVITPHTIEKLEPFTMFALGIIGFMIGAELRAEIFRKYGRQFFIILFSQGFGAFFLVIAGASALAWFILPSIIPDIVGAERLQISLAMGLVFGAIASATAPAATVNVLWEYKTKGPLTTAVLAIVALDDALALLLYRVAATGAKALIGTGQDSVWTSVLILFGEIVGAIALGILAGVLLYFLLKFVKAEDKVLDFAIASLLLVVGISMIPRIDPILPAMTLGITIANLMPRQSKAIFKLVEKFSPPIYISFFVLAGAHMEFGKITGWIVMMIAVYVLCRAAGKVLGSWFGGEWSHAPAVVRRYLGICLLPQAGVAIGLAILASQQFDSEIGHTIVIVVMAGTFLMEIFGPILVKVGVKQAGEVGLNITEEDLIETYNVADVMDKDVPVISAGMSLIEVIEVVSKTDNFYYSVVDKDKKLMGAVTLDGIRNTFSTQELNDWLVALDIMEPIVGKITPDMPLSRALEKMRKLDVEHIPVVSPDDDNFVGILGSRKVRRSLSAEVLSRQQKADSMA
ncbi:MAG: cation:proton antiporter domain-containing protein [Planctomycetota bacterium]|jgi:Kef-type K+ transport system membrane component KefB